MTDDSVSQHNELCNACDKNTVDILIDEIMYVTIHDGNIRRIYYSYTRIPGMHFGLEVKRLKQTIPWLIEKPRGMME